MDAVMFETSYILIVDDMVTNLKVVQGLLSNYGIKASVAKSGEQALAILKQSGITFDAIFMDHLMPGMDGIETVKHIREDTDLPYLKTVPVIAMTADAGEGSEKIFLENGFQDYLPKPVNQAKLETVLRTWIKGSPPG